MYRHRLYTDNLYKAVLSLFGRGPTGQPLVIKQMSNPTTYHPVNHITAMPHDTKMVTSQHNSFPTWRGPGDATKRSQRLYVEKRRVTVSICFYVYRRIKCIDEVNSLRDKRQTTDDDPNPLELLFALYLKMSKMGLEKD